MQILKQLHRKVIRLAEYFLVYLIGAFLIVGVFSLIYDRLGISAPLDVSVDIFFGLENIAKVPKYIHLSQIVVQNIFFVAWIGTFLSSLLRPLNPFFFSKYIVLYHGRLILRYWIMFPAHQFLYDIRIRLILSGGNPYNGGVNRLSGEWQFCQELNLARGVHYVSLSEKDSKMVLKRIEQLENGGKTPVLAMMIQGSNENGLTFFGRKPYVLKNALKTGYNFAPIRQPECVQIAKGLGYGKAVPSKPSLIWYHNFDKLYQASGKAEPGSRDVLTCRQLAEGKYGPGVRQTVSDLICRVISRLLDKNGYRDFARPSDLEK